MCVYTYIPAPTTFAGMAEDADSEQRVAAAAAAAADREASLVAAASVGLAERTRIPG